MPRTKEEAEEEAAWAALLAFRMQMCDKDSPVPRDRSLRLTRLRYLVSQWQRAMTKHIEDTGHSVA